MRLTLLAPIQLALNEANVLSMLEHRNIIGYFDSFEEVWSPSRTTLPPCISLLNLSSYQPLRTAFCRLRWSMLTAARSTSF